MLLYVKKKPFQNDCKYFYLTINYFKLNMLYLISIFISYIMYYIIYGSKHVFSMYLISGKLCEAF